MSLVGSSVRVVSSDDDTPLRVETVEEEEADTTSRQEEVVTAYETAYHDAHPPPTPPGAAESLFLSGLPTHSISAAALAQQIHLRHRPLSLAGTSIATDDFCSAHQPHDNNNNNMSDDDDPFSLHNSSLLVEHDVNDSYLQHRYDDADDDTPFGNDALIHTREALFQDDTMAAKTTSTTTTVPKTAVQEDKPMHVDPAEKIYGTAKGVWGWGKGIIIFSPFMGIAEGIAGKIVETAGSSLEDLDTAVLEKLHGLDDGVLNPAIAKIVGTLLGAKGKTEDFVMPILSKILSPFGLLKDKPEGESTLKPSGETATAK